MQNLDESEVQKRVVASASNAFTQIVTEILNVTLATCGGSTEMGYAVLNSAAKKAEAHMQKQIINPSPAPKVAGLPTPKPEGINGVKR